MEEDRERETDGVMGRERVLQAERKGSPTDLTVLICRICKERGGQQLFDLDVLVSVIIVCFLKKGHTIGLSHPTPTRSLIS